MAEAAADDDNDDKSFSGGEGADSGFQRALIHRQDADPVGAQQYSFFGGFDDGAADSLGGLEEGVDAPPEEERLGGALEEAEEVDLSELDPDLAGDADLSFATMFARGLEDPDRAETPFASSLDAQLGGPNTPLGGSSGPVGGGSGPSDSLSGLIGALPGLSASAGRSAAAAASSAFSSGFSGGLPPPASGLLNDPWGQLTGLALPVPVSQGAPQQQADQQPAAALAGFGPLDPVVPPPQPAQGLLNVDRLELQPNSQQQQQQQSVLQQQSVPPLPPPQQQQQLQQAQAQMAAVRITAPMTVQQLEEQMRMQAQGGGAAPPPPPAPGPHQWPPPQHQLSSPNFPQQPQQLNPQQAAAAAAQRAAQAVYAAQRPMPPPQLMAGQLLPRPPPGMPPPTAPPGMPPGGPRSYAAMLGGQQRPPPGFMLAVGAHMRPGMGPPFPGPRPPPGWPGLPRPPPGMPPMGPPPPGWVHPMPPGAAPQGMPPGSGMPPGRPLHMPPPQHQGARQRFHSKYMDADEIDSILRIQWRSLHNGPSYVEDYYYQAFINKHFKGCNARWFAPERIRELAPSERGERGAATFVSLEGLGRIPFSNIRRPKPLMDVGGTPREQTAQDGDDSSKNGGIRRARRPLEQEPAMAARIMIEDCLALLLDVQDVDRLFAASPSGSPEGEVPLRRRRALLMDGLSASLRLAAPEAIAPAGAQDSAGAAAAGGKKGGKGRRGTPDDGVLRRLLGLRKGRDLLARALALMCPPQGAHTEPGGRAVKVQSMALLFGLLRNLRLVFELPPSPDQVDLSLGLRVASAAVGVIRRIDSPLAIASALAAAAGGDLAPAGAATPAENADNGEAQQPPPSPDSLLPLYPPDTKAGEGQGLWLAELLAALLVRAAEVEPAAAPQPAPEAWDTAWASFFPLLARHLETLQMVHAMATEQGLGPAAELAQGMVPIPLIRATLLHASQPQQERIRALLAELA